MRRMIALLYLWMIGLTVLTAQDDEDLRAIAALLGPEFEEVDGDEVERLEGLLRSPLCLNAATRQILVTSGLFSGYQAASLMDYISRHGAVMSLMELASVDGFSEAFIGRIRPFISLEPPSSSMGKKVRNNVTLRTSFRSSSGVARWGYAARYRLVSGDALSASIAVNRSLDAEGPAPDALCGSVRWSMRKVPLRLVLGDFNARFGQGLTLWNGMFMTSLTSPSMFLRRPSGVTPTSSFTGSSAYTGAAAQMDMGRFSLTFMLAAPGIKAIREKPGKVRLLPAFNLVWNCRNGQLGMTHHMESDGLARGKPFRIPVMKTSVDAAFCIKGTDLFSEAAFDWVTGRISALAGCVAPVGDDWDVAGIIRMLPEEYSAVLSGSLSSGKWILMSGSETSSRRISGTASADFTLYTVPKSDTQDRSAQLKLHSQWKFILSESFCLDLRMTERLRSWENMSRTDVRADLTWRSESFSVTSRLNALNCVGTSLLGYVECGFLPSRISLYLRQGFFLVDDWDDRIYVYERDAQGCFNVPAFYGRGLWTSFVSSCKFARWGRLYFRAAYTSYLFMKEKKPGKMEARLQLIVDF